MRPFIERFVTLPCHPKIKQLTDIQYVELSLSRGGGIRTPGTLRFNGFQDRRIRPLCHSSVLVKLLHLHPKPCGSTVFAKGIPLGQDRRISQRDGFAETALPLLFILVKLLFYSQEPYRG